MLFYFERATETCSASGFTSLQNEIMWTDMMDWMHNYFQSNLF